MKKVDVIIPFYNEENRLVETVKLVLKAKNVNKIICINDGSIDNSSNQLKKTDEVNTDKIKIVEHIKNKGKAEAIKSGLKFAESEHILLLDADLKNLDSKYIDAIIERVKDQTNMVILSSQKELLLLKIIRSNFLFSGQRIIKKGILIDIYKKMANFKNYQLEVAINQYFIDNKLNFSWIKSDLLNYRSYEKFSAKLSLKKELYMFISIVRYLGVYKYIMQILFFRGKEINL